MSVRWVGPRWLESTARRFDIDIFDRVVVAELVNSALTDDDLNLLTTMRHLDEVIIGSETSITAEGIRTLRRSRPGVKVTTPERPKPATR